MGGACEKHGEKRHAYRVLIGKCEVKRSLGRARCKRSLGRARCGSLCTRHEGI
jgi:hypothetical protein